MKESSCACCMDPLNSDCYYIFGVFGVPNTCYRVNIKEKTFERIADMPEHQKFGCQCVVIEPTDREYYALIYKNATPKMCVIYDFKNNQWIEQNKTNQRMTCEDFYPSVTIDIFKKNIVHIAAKLLKEYNYGYFKFNGKDKSITFVEGATLPTIPDKEKNDCRIFYFNIEGSMNQNDVKLVAMCVSEEGKLDNSYLCDNDKQWKPTKLMH